MDLHQVVISRSGYTFLDLFSDIGGLLSLLIIAAQLLLIAVTFNRIENHMVSKLYKMRGDNENKKIPRYDLPLDWNLDTRCFIRSIMPGCCCKPSLKDKSFAIGRKMLEHETNIV